jgi:hypothetical protein
VSGRKAELRIKKTEFSGQIQPGKAFYTKRAKARKEEDVVASAEWNGPGSAVGFTNNTISDPLFAHTNVSIEFMVCRSHPGNVAPYWMSKNIAGQAQVDASASVTLATLAPSQLTSSLFSVSAGRTRVLACGT